MADLKWIDATLPSVKGLIKVKMKRSDDQFNLTLTSPAATTAIVGVPKDVLPKIVRVEVNGTTILKQGVTCGTLNGIVYMGDDAHYYKFTVTPGTWIFKATRND